MSWLSDLLSKKDPITFDQEIELLCARWMDRSRKGNETLTRNEIADSLRYKAQQMSPRSPKFKGKGHATE